MFERFVRQQRNYQVGCCVNSDRMRNPPKIDDYGFITGMNSERFIVSYLGEGRVDVFYSDCLGQMMKTFPPTKEGIERFAEIHPQLYKGILEGYERIFGKKE